MSPNILKSFFSCFLDLWFSTFSFPLITCLPLKQIYFIWIYQTIHHILPHKAAISFLANSHSMKELNEELKSPSMEVFVFVCMVSKLQEERLGVLQHRSIVILLKQNTDCLWGSSWISFWKKFLEPCHTSGVEHMEDQMKGRNKTTTDEMRWDR